MVRTIERLILGLLVILLLASGTFLVTPQPAAAQTSIALENFSGLDEQTLRLYLITLIQQLLAEMRNIEVHDAVTNSQNVHVVTDDDAKQIRQVCMAEFESDFRGTDNLVSSIKTPGAEADHGSTYWKVYGDGTAEKNEKLDINVPKVDRSYAYLSDDELEQFVAYLCENGTANQNDVRNGAIGDSAQNFRIDIPSIQQTHYKFHSDFTGSLYEAKKMLFELDYE